MTAPRRSFQRILRSDPEPGDLVMPVWIGGGPRDWMHTLTPFVVSGVDDKSVWEEHGDGRRFGLLKRFYQFDLIRGVEEPDITSVVDVP